MENTNNGIILTVLALVVSLIGNIAQYIWPTRKSKTDDESVVSSTIKNIAEAYTMTLKSLQDRIEKLEKESKSDKLVIEQLEKRVREQDVEIQSLKDIIERFQKKAQ